MSGSLGGIGSRQSVSMNSKDPRPRASTVNQAAIIGLRSSAADQASDSAKLEQQIELSQHQQPEVMLPEDSKSSSSKSETVTKQQVSQFEDEDWRDDVDGIVPLPSQPVHSQ